MKKRLFIILICLVLALSLVMTFVACDDDTPEGPVEPDNPVGPVDPVEKTFTITYTEADGIIYSENNPTTVKEGESFTFSFKVDVFYEGDPVVSVNNRERSNVQYNDETYLYSCTVGNASKDNVVAVSGVEASESELLTTGTGAIDSPFLINEPIDLIKMAEVINAGADNNAMNVLGYYSLEEDLDFEGQEIKIIGDGNNDYAFFGGYFNGNGHTISNFVINGTSDYVGLFGVVQAYDMLGFTGGTIYNLKISNFKVSATNSGSTVICGSMVGQGFGASMILCDALNGTVEIYGNANNFSYAGGLIGLQRAYQDPFYSKINYCSTQNVDVNCLLGTTFVAGGVSGYVYSESATVNATITNCYSTGNVRGSFYAGGVVGWLSNYSAIANCYSTGIVNAQTSLADISLAEEYCHAYAGGLVGMAQNDSSIVDSFTSSKVSATAKLGSSYAHTGEIVGRVEELNSSIFGSRLASVYNCYYVGAGVENAPDFTDGDVVKEKLHWHEIDWLFNEGSYPVVNSVNSDSSSDSVLHYEYVITINFGDAVVKDLNGNDLNKIEITITDQYESMSFWYTVYSTYLDGTGIPESLVAENGMISYGYFFDKDCTLYVPCGFTATRDITLYAGFADYNEVAGTYYVAIDGKDSPDSLTYAAITLYNDGTFACDDTFSSHLGYYIYDGKEIVFYNARFARYYGESSYLSYQPFEYKGLIQDNGLAIYGGISYDEDGNEIMLIADSDPLYAIKESKSLVGSYYTNIDGEVYVYTFNANGIGLEERNYDEFEYSISNGELTITINGDTLIGVIENGIPVSIDGHSVSKTDSFRGKWEINSLSNKVYEFDGAGNWSYLYFGYVYDKERNTSYQDIISRANGSYTINGDEILLDNGVKAIISDGMLEIINDNGSVHYSFEKSNQGSWISIDESIALVLNGIKSTGDGKGVVTFVHDEDGVKMREVYELVYTHDTLTSNGILLYYQGELFGMLSFNSARGSLEGTIYSSDIGDYIDLEVFRYDEYKGDWYGVDNEPLFSIINFNGYGNYSFNTSIPLSGKLLINGDAVEYSLNDFTLSGTFMYKDLGYTISYDEESSLVTIAYNGINYSFTQSDELGGKTFIDEEGNTYKFDGKGALPTLGTLSIHSVTGVVTVGYSIGGDDGVVATLTDGTSPLGTVTIKTLEDGRYYCISMGDSNIILSEKTVFTGKWALSGYYDDYVTIGGMNLDGIVKGIIPLAVDEDINQNESLLQMVNDYLVWSVDENNTIYVINIAENEFVISRYLNWFIHDSSETSDDGDTIWNYSYAMVEDDLRGVWKCALLDDQLTFDGLGRNPEALGIYSQKNILQGDDDAVDYYYGRCWNIKEECYDYLVFSEYSTQTGIAQKVVFCDYDGAPADAYINEETKTAFVLEIVALKSDDGEEQYYDLTNRQ